MDLAAPDLLWLLLAAPFAAGLAAFVWRRRLRATAAWASRDLWDRLAPSVDRRRVTISVVLLTLAIVGAALGLARPRWGSSEQTIERQGVDVVFVLDTSLSMATRDVSPNRLWVAQTLIRQLAQQLPGHRVALVQAEGDGVVLAPLTADTAVLDLLLDAVLPGSLPTPGTELAPALERAAELFPESSGKHQVMVLFSDGEDHGEGLDDIADELVERAVVLHAVGVGTREGKPLEMPLTEPGVSGRTAEYKRDEAGQVVVSRLEEQNLEMLARRTEGLYLRASGAATELTPLVEAIDAMERRGYGSETLELFEERFQWPLGLAIVALALHLGFGPFRHHPETAP